MNKSKSHHSAQQPELSSDASLEMLSSIKGTLFEMGKSKSEDVVQQPESSTDASQERESVSEYPQVLGEGEQESSNESREVEGVITAHERWETPTKQRAMMPALSHLPAYPQCQENHIFTNTTNTSGGGGGGSSSRLGLSVTMRWNVIKGRSEVVEMPPSIKELRLKWENQPRLFTLHNLSRMLWCLRRRW